MRRTLLLSLMLSAAAVVLLCGVAIEPSWACSPGIQTCSPSYNVNEAYFGTGGAQGYDKSVGHCKVGSANYCADQTAGDLAAGNTRGTLYQAQAGFNTDRTPSLALLVNDTSCQDYNAAGVNINLGALSTGHVTTANANFSIKSYLASGYVVTTVGSAPTSNGPTPHTLSTPTGSSTPGVEQFGINLATNTTPAVGHGVQQLPDSTFGFGGVNAGYGTANSFKYTNGDAIASSTRSSGTTCYDISYVFNISSVTPAGLYTMNQSIVATGTF